MGDMQQHFFVLSVNLVSTIKIGKKKKKGAIRWFGSPNKQVQKGTHNNSTGNGNTGAGDDKEEMYNE